MPNRTLLKRSSRRTIGPRDRVDELDAEDFAVVLEDGAEPEWLV